jgi:hypothetical protein
MANKRRFENGWVLLKASMQVMKKDKKLFVFPIIIASSLLIIAILFLSPIVFSPTGYSYLDPAHWKAVGSSIFTHSSGHGQLQFTHRGSAYFIILYFLLMFLATFFNVAFYREIINALKNRRVSIGGGLRFACSRIKQVLVWSLFAGLVGYIIRFIEGKLNFVGKIILQIIGMAWSIASMFAIPVIINEDVVVSPIETLKRSAKTIKKTWGEALIGYVGLEVSVGLFVFPPLLLVIASFFVSMAINNFWLFGFICLCWILGLIILGYIIAVAGHIYRCALYLFAAEGVVPAPYTREAMDYGWKMKK